MALPTAQLGSMASLNVPSYLPTQVVRKEPKLWQTALAQLLTQAAGTAVSKGVDNVMSRDYAEQFGETPASTGSRLFQGPQVGAREAEQRRSIAAGKESDLRNIIAQGNRERLSQTEATNRATVGVENDISREQMAYDRLMAEMAIREKEMGMKDRLGAAEIRKANLLEQIRAERERPGREAETAERVARTEKIRGETTQAKELHDLITGKGKKVEGNKPSANVAKFAAGQKQVSSVAPTQSDPAMDAVLQRFLRPSGGPMTEEALRASLGGSTPTSEQILRFILQNNGMPQ